MLAGILLDLRKYSSTYNDVTIARIDLNLSEAREVKAEDCPAGASRIVPCLDAVAGDALGTSGRAVPGPGPSVRPGGQELPLGCCSRRPSAGRS